MKAGGMRSWIFVLAILGFLSARANAANLITTDVVPALKSDEGIAGISFDSFSVELDQITFTATSSNGGTLVVPHVSHEQGIFLFVAPAGRYCLEINSLSKNGVNVSAKQSDECFDVEAGKLSYSNTYVLSFTKRELLSGMHRLTGSLTREDRRQAFLDAVNKNFPHIFSAFQASDGVK